MISNRIPNFQKGSFQADFKAIHLSLTLFFCEAIVKAGEAEEMLDHSCSWCSKKSLDRHKVPPVPLHYVPPPLRGKMPTSLLSLQHLNYLISYVTSSSPSEYDLVCWFSPEVMWFSGTFHSWNTFLSPEPPSDLSACIGPCSDLFTWDCDP